MGKGKYNPFLKLHSVTFSYDSAPDSLFQEITLHISQGWTGVVGANGTGKTTLLKLASGLLEPVTGHIEKPWDSYYCPQITDHIPDQFKEFILSTNKEAQLIKQRLKVESEWLESRDWLTLSPGERKRAQIAIALWLEPDILAIDEPTNHLDSEARYLIAQALMSYKKIGLLVSHDRELLDSLCDQCVFISPPGALLRKGNYSQLITSFKEEQDYLLKQRELKKQSMEKLNKEAGRRSNLAKQSNKKRSKRGLAKKDHDSRAKINLAKLTGKDATGGKLYRQMQGRLEKTQKELENIKVQKQYTMGIWLPGSISQRDSLLLLPAGSLSMGEKKELFYPELSIKPNDRIAITGFNGAGKSTILRFIITALNVPNEHITYLPQEITTEQSQQLLNQTRHLPDHQLGHLMTIINRLGSRPHRLLESVEPSPGETRKLLLALGMTREPHIILMDEPTNHLDLPSIEYLEEALSDCPCCLVLVSHDKPFLQKLTHTQWDIKEDQSAPGAYQMSIS